MTPKKKRKKKRKKEKKKGEPNRDVQPSLM